MLDVNKINKFIYSNLTKFGDVYMDELPSDFDFSGENYGILYRTNNIHDRVYKDVISLDVILVSNIENKAKLLNISMSIHNALNRLCDDTGGIRIINTSNYLNELIDDDNKQNIVLTYYVLNYR